MIFGSWLDHIKYSASEMLSHFADFFGTGVINPSSDFPLTYPSTPNMTVNVGAGTARVNGYRVANDGNPLVSLLFSAADPSHARIDLIQVGPVSSPNISLGVNQNLGKITVKTGTPAVTPVQPTPDANMVPLYAVAVAANQATITAGNMTDLRSRVTFWGYDVVAKFVDYDAHMLRTTGGTMTAGTIVLYQNPVNTMDAATKQYVDQSAQGLQPKVQCRVATTGSNITLSGTQTIDGVAVVAGDRVLVKDQTSQPTNGIYVVASGAWSRSTDTNTGALLVGAYCYIGFGSTLAGSTWYQQAPNPITLGTTNITWGLFSTTVGLSGSNPISYVSGVISLIANGITNAYLAVGAAVANLGFTPVNKAGDNLTGALNEAMGTNIASAATTNIAAATGNFVQVTGTNTITALGTAQAGTKRTVEFTGALTLTYNATSLILPGLANITTAAGDTAEFVSLGSGNWLCYNYQQINGQNIYIIAESLGTNGWRKWSDGFIEQWGQYTSPDRVQNTNHSVSFPIAFPTGCLNIMVSDFADLTEGSNWRVTSAPGTSSFNVAFSIYNVNSSALPQMYYTAKGK